jgi:hypothetical protein
MTKGIGTEFVREQKGEEIRSIARITVSAISDLVPDLWCYEDKFGVGEGHPQADGMHINLRQFLQSRRLFLPTVPRVRAEGGDRFSLQD